mmetsp:Transcript_34045/g.44990  ORF Transcript_34045/g.44990 Transcript_34045/m.44990 type:complete len:395 (+) Transcript_34045:31-1215(+)|eukprot:CAMPEP_0117763840 /NCGR_PEP_ID=MMETSP0947-20121206/18968_1 /TAXON_ID=44440 /ORGANISM="Chattonella subsalsa, Strain CCMP2191" /LENGTH=394 /DNA_ID=CAMNT_0005585805 /DNA_START=1 /DNA_END=1185 /DNA_ORIENTATION=+
MEGGSSVQQIEKPCSTPGCDKTSNLRCPTCVKLGIPPSFYCSQDCFKSHWPQHKAFHKLVKQAQKAASKPLSLPGEGGLPAGFDGFEFTGPLRPCPYGPQLTVPSNIPRPDYADNPQGYPTSEVQDRRTNNNIRVYTPEEIEGIREACRIGREALDAGGRAVRVGATCDEINRVVHETIVGRGAYPSPLNYYNFPRSVCTSVNEVICHGIPDTYVLKEGDIVNIDVTAYYQGYHGDLNETFLVGEVASETLELVETAFDCLKQAMSLVKPGTMYKALGDKIAARAKSSGCSVVKRYCGHGIGTLFHTAPNVPHYSKNKAKGVMKPGHVFTIEPMINRGDWRDVTWPDNWTAVTEDGSLSAQYEHTILVTEDGFEILTARENEPIMEWSQEKVQR